MAGGYRSIFTKKPDLQNGQTRRTGSNCRGIRANFWNWTIPRRILGKRLMWNLLWSSVPRFADQSYGSPRQAEAMWLSPSWSWASRSHPIYFDIVPDIVNVEEDSEVLTIEIEPVYAPFPKGALRSASITLRCYSWRHIFPHTDKYNNVIFDDEPCNISDRFVYYCSLTRLRLACYATFMALWQ